MDLLTVLGAGASVVPPCCRIPGYSPGREMETTKGPRKACSAHQESCEAVPSDLSTF